MHDTADVIFITARSIFAGSRRTSQANEAGIGRVDILMSCGAFKAAIAAAKSTPPNWEACEGATSRGRSARTDCLAPERLLCLEEFGIV